MNSKSFSNERLKELWHKIIYNLDYLDYEEQLYLVGYFDCVVDSNFNLEIINRFYELLEEKMS